MRRQRGKEGGGGGDGSFLMERTRTHTQKFKCSKRWENFINFSYFRKNL